MKEEYNYKSLLPPSASGSNLIINEKKEKCLYSTLIEFGICGLIIFFIIFLCLGITSFCYRTYYQSWINSSCLIKEQSYIEEHGINSMGQNMSMDYVITWEVSYFNKFANQERDGFIKLGFSLRQEADALSYKSFYSKNSTHECFYSEKVEALIWKRDYENWEIIGIFSLIFFGLFIILFISTFFCLFKSKKK
jgi:hypothetical protein